MVLDCEWLIAGEASNILSPTSCDTMFSYRTLSGGKFGLIEARVRRIHIHFQFILDHINNNCHRHLFHTQQTLGGHNSMKS